MEDKISVQVIEGMQRDEVCISQSDSSPSVLPSEKDASPELTTSYEGESESKINKITVKIEKDKQDSGTLNTEEESLMNNNNNNSNNNNNNTSSDGRTDEEGNEHDDPLVWDGGVGSLPLTELKFRYNELGCLEIDESSSGSQDTKSKREKGKLKTPNHEKGALPPDKKRRKLGQVEEAAASPPEPILKQKGKYFPWNSYLEKKSSQAAANSCFLKPYPTKKNHFKPHTVLEGIDPKHPSLYCVLNIVQIQGYRLRLNFEGYSNAYDFWVNADSTFIFPPGWCSRNGKKLQPPPNQSDFDWSKIPENKHAHKSLFTITNSQNYTAVPQIVEVGMKLEAVDKKNTVLTCVATIADIVADKVLIHFDGWEEDYDYWCDLSSPYVHQVGWCQANAKALSPPPSWTNIKTFTWEKYLEHTNSKRIPQRAFRNRSISDFESNTKLEVVDIRNPSLIRVATIVKTDSNRLLIHYDGWPDYLDSWVDDDSTDLHPCGWCAKTGHALQPPLDPIDLKSSNQTSGCPTPGCTGVGHVKGASHQTHHSVFGCPYNVNNLSKEFVPDRLKSLNTAETRVNESKKCPTPGCDSSGHVTGKYPFHHKVSGCPLAAAQRESSSSSRKRGRKPIHKTEPLAIVTSVKYQRKVLSCVTIGSSDEIEKWSIDDVSEFVRSLPGCHEYGRKFKEEEIDGESFLLAKQEDFVERMGLKLGPALKIATALNVAKYST